MKTRNYLHKGVKKFSSLDDEEKAWVVKTLKNTPDVPEVFFEQVIKVLETQIRKPYVFLSYSSKDKRFVRGLAAKLETAGIRVWLDEAEIKVGQSLIGRLREAIDSVDFLVVILSKASVESHWVQKELDIAMNQEIKRKKVKVLPILKEVVDLPGFLEGKLYLDFSTPRLRPKVSKKLIEHILSYDIAFEKLRKAWDMQERINIRIKDIRKWKT